MTEAMKPQVEKETQGDETLEIVRLMIETEERHAETHREPLPTTVNGLEKQKSATPASRMATLEHQTEDKIPNEARVSDALPMTEASRGFEPQRRAMLERFPVPREDLSRKRRHMPPLPRLKLPKPSLKRAAEPSARKTQMNRQDAVQYAKLAGLVAGALIIFFKPWVLPLVLFVLLWLSLILFLVLGGARISELLQAGWRGYARRRPEASARMLARLQRSADRVDGLLARLPEKWADGIYTPDLGRSTSEWSAAAVADLAEDPFDKLAAREAS